MSTRPFAACENWVLVAFIEEDATLELADAVRFASASTIDTALDNVIAFADRLVSGSAADDLRNAVAELRLRAHSEAA